MKRIAVLALLAAFVLASVGTASAEVVVKANGQFRVVANWINNFGLNKYNSDQIDTYDDFFVRERARIDFRFVANENLEGVFYIEYGNADWGSPNVMAIGDSGGGTASIGVRRAYVSFRWPDTDVLFNVGLQNIALPSAYSGGYVLNEDVTGATVTAPINDMFTVVAGYVRAFDQSGTKATEGDTNQGTKINNKAAEADFGFVAVPITPEGINFSPWFVYGYAGSNATTAAGFPTKLVSGLLGPNSTNYAGEGTNMYWAGAALTVDMFDPIVVMADFNWGQKTSSVKQLRRNGWFMDFAVQYTGLDFMTPEVVFAYGSGEDDDPNNGSERMPVLMNDDSFALGSFFFGGSSLSPGDMGGSNNQQGYWAVALQLKDITFLEKLSHDFYFVYAQGTNDHKLLKDNYNSGLGLHGITYGRTLFDKDSLFEVDFNTNYQIYEELSAVLELGWVYADFDEDTWNRVNSGMGGVQQAWKCSLGALYNF